MSSVCVYDPNFSLPEIGDTVILANRGLVLHLGS